MSDILKEIILHKREEVEAAKAKRPLSDIMALLPDLPPTRSLKASLLNHPEGGIISEFKRRSPSKGWIRQDARVEDVIPAYEKAGAAALSILTDLNFFGGHLNDILVARPLSSLPILRKDFVIDAYQLFEARAAGADACLLIASVLDAAACHHLAAVAHDVGLEVLLEIHEEKELEAFSPYVDIIGVNNRNLHLFQTDPGQSVKLFPLLPKEAVPISESGLLKPSIAAQLSSVGYKGFLIGEAFMKEAQPGEALALYRQELQQPER